MIAHYYNEIDPYCCKVLRARIADGSLPDGYVDERDIREVAPADLAGFTQCHFFAGIGGFALGIKWAGAEHLQLATAGFPCQDISMAGPRDGLAGARSGLWFELTRFLCPTRFDYLILENVAAMLIPINGRTPAPISRVLGDLAASGFDAEWDCLPAGFFGAEHFRDRAFVVAHTLCKGLSVGREARAHREDATNILSRVGFTIRTEGAGLERCGAARWRGNVHGIPNRVDRIHALGNAVVPQVVEHITRAILAADA